MSAPMTTYTLDVTYAGYYGKQITVEVPTRETPEETLAAAIEEAIEQANDSDTWRSLDDCGSTFVSAICEGDGDPWTANPRQPSKIPVPFARTEIGTLLSGDMTIVEDPRTGLVDDIATMLILLRDLAAGAKPDQLPLPIADLWDRMEPKLKALGVIDREGAWRNVLEQPAAAPGPTLADECALLLTTIHDLLEGYQVRELAEHPTVFFPRITARLKAAGYTDTEAWDLKKIGF